MPMPSKYQKYYDGLRGTSIDNKANNAVSLGTTNSSTISKLSSSLASGSWTELGVVGLKESVGITLEDANILNNNLGKLSDACSKTNQLKEILDRLKEAYDKYDNLKESDFYTTDDKGEKHLDSSAYNAKKKELKDKCESIEKEADSKISEINALTVSEIKDLSLAVVEAEKVVESLQSTANYSQYKNPKGLSGFRLNFVNSVVKGAIEAYNKYGVLPSLTIAQAIEESGWGQSTIGHNIFGIKAGDNWTGKVKRTKTAEQRKNGSYYQIYDNFRDYDSFEESIEDHAKLLATPRYKRVIQSKNYVDACKAVKACGYATSLDYAQKLINIVSKYGLNQWDPK